jgi:20S proteasome subunit beta 2
VLRRCGPCLPRSVSRENGGAGGGLEARAAMQSIDETGGFGFGALAAAPARVPRRCGALWRARQHTADVTRVCMRADLVRRNASLAGLGLKAPTATKTGTTIAGIVFKARDALCVQAGFACTSARGVQRGRAEPGRVHTAPQDGVVLGADTRSTNGDTVADKNCEKIHYIAPNIYCCGAGTAADTEAVTGARAACVPRSRAPLAAVLGFVSRHSPARVVHTSLPPLPPRACRPGMVSSALELHRYAVGRKSRVVTALTLLKSHLFRYQGHVSAALVLGGVDVTGAHLHTVYPHGSTDTLPFVTMGSGSLAAMAVFEADYREELGREEACALVARAIKAGIFNDLGSGSNVDLCVITADGKEYLRNWETPNARTYTRDKGFTFPRGTTQLSHRVAPIAAAATPAVNSFVAVSEGLPEGTAAAAAAAASAMDTA